MTDATLVNTINLYEYYKSLGEKAMAQVRDDALFYAPDEKSNSIGVIVKHLHGNMLSRWTDFLTTDGEKAWRKRDDEFIETTISREELLKLWDEGWACLFDAIKSLKPEDLSKTVYIRNMGQSVEDALMRQLAHYAYHIGQIVYLCRLFNQGDWKSLTIPKGSSEAYNKERFDQPLHMKHFTGDTFNSGKKA